MGTNTFEGRHVLRQSIEVGWIIIDQLVYWVSFQGLWNWLSLTNLLFINFCISQSRSVRRAARACGIAWEMAGTA